MKKFTRGEEQFLMICAGFGFLVPNGWFLYSVLTNPEWLRDALGNPVAQVFMLEAGLLVGLLAWLVARRGSRPGWRGFIFLSLIGSLACSVPAYLVLVSRDQRSND